MAQIGSIPNLNILYHRLTISYVGHLTSLQPPEDDLIINRQEQHSSLCQLSAVKEKRCIERKKTKHARNTSARWAITTDKAAAMGNDATRKDRQDNLQLAGGNTSLSQHLTSFYVL